MFSGHFVLTVGQCCGVVVNTRRQDAAFNLTKSIYSWKLYSKYIVHNAKWKVHNKISTSRIVGPIFFNNTVNSHVYVTKLLQPFIAQLTEEHEYAFSQQDGATAHTSRFSMPYVHESFGEERTVSTGLWPPRLTNLSICDFYLRRQLKGQSLQ